MDDALVISLKPSRMEYCLQWVLVWLALLALALSALSMLAKVSLALLALALCGRQWRQQHQEFVSMIACDANGWWIVRSGQKIAIELRGEQRVLSWLVALQWRESASARRGSLALWPDSAEAEALRRLRVRLRFPQQG